MAGASGDSEAMRLEFPGGMEAAGAARAALAERLRERMAAARLEELRLLVTELVANSVRHGGVDGRGRIVIEVELLDDRARVQVSDTGAQGEPELLPPDLGGGGGFGLYLVDRIALRWGAEHDPDLRVWFELARS